MKVSNRVLAVLALAAVVLWCLSLAYCGRVQMLCGSVSVRWDSGGVSPAELERQLEYARQDKAQNMPQTTLWQEEARQAVRSDDERSAEADTVKVFGSCAAVTVHHIIAGAFPARSDTEGCAVSKGLAHALWGSTNVIGLPVYIDGATYYVRGVTDGGECTLYRQERADSNATLANMQLEFSSGGSRAEAEAFLARTGFGGGAILDLPLLGWACTAVSRLPVFALAIGIAVRLISRMRHLGRYPMLLLRFLPLCVLAVAALLLCMDMSGIPARVVPTMWSDFDFWQRLFSGFGSAIEAWLSSAPTTRDAQLWPAVFVTLITAIPAAAAAVLFAVLARVRSYTGLIGGGALYMICVCLVSAAMSGIGTAEFSKSVYLVPCLWLCVDAMLRWHEKTLTPCGGGRKEDGHEEAVAQKAQGD